APPRPPPASARHGAKGSRRARRAHTLGRVRCRTTLSTGRSPWARCAPPRSRRRARATPSRRSPQSRRPPSPSSGPAAAALDEQPDRLEQVAVDVVLDLVGGAVPDPHGRRVPVAREVAELALLGARGAVDAVEDLQTRLGQP